MYINLKFTKGESSSVTVETAEKLIIAIWYTIDMYLGANKTFYTYELSSNFNSENAINYFDNQRAKNQGNLGQGETITRDIDIENTALIQFYDYSIEEVQIGTTTTLDFALDSVL